MRKKLLQIGGLLLIALLIVMAVSSFLNARHSASSVCSNLLKAIQQDDATKSYSLFSKNLAGQESASDWKAQVTNLNKVYGKSSSFKQTAEIKSLNPSTDNPETELHYELTSSPNKYAITCRAVKSGNRYLVDSFVSHLAD
ncbi:MAG TPA: hypothetical protein VLG37_03720 [Candidatus Saccharimonadales bacterium]|nr:hypothetical protein [Candidatus Saccharimonadales bacterium]